MALELKVGENASVALRLKVGAMVTVTLVDKSEGTGYSDPNLKV